MVSFESKVNRGREGEKKCAAKLHCRPKRRMEKVGGSNKKKGERERKSIEGRLGNPRRRRRRRRRRWRKRKETERKGENAAKPAHGCCVLLHFVLTWCMRLLGNSPYAPFIYNSAANAGHASPHPRSVIRLRSAL